MKNTAALALFLFSWQLLSWAQEGPAGHRDFSKPYEDIVAQMRGLYSDAPDFVQMVTLGQNDQGIEIWGLRLESPQTLEGKVAHLLVGTHHGNEQDAAPLSMAFARKVLAILQGGQSANQELAASGIYYVFPVLNISGYNMGYRREQDAAGIWHDSNRDYPDPCVTHKYFKLQSIALLAEFVEVREIVSAVSIHGYIGTFTYPWGFYTQDTKTPDHDIYHQLLSHAAAVNQYRVGNHKDVIYPATGSFEDWAYHDHGVWVALLEMKRNPDYATDVDALMRFFIAAPRERSLNHAHYGQCMEMIFSDAFERSLINTSRP